MNRSEFLKASTAGLTGLFISEWVSKAITSDNAALLTSKMFGENFKWGVTTSAFQSEGAWNADGKGESIWDRFTHNKHHVLDHSNADVTCDFYHLYKEDLRVLKSMNFKNFRFSIAWSRIFPEGIGKINEQGVAFYNNVIDECLRLDITPWMTLYHWDLPQALEDKGGWANREIINWFTEFVDLCTKRFGDRVKNWIIINEPAAVTTLGYLTGLHAPGHKSIGKFLASVHHVMMCQAEGARIVRKNVVNARIGTAQSCSYVETYKNNPANIKAVKRIDVLLNRLFIEPSLGMGYPTSELHFLKKIEKYILPGDMEKLKFDFDFIGLQNYFRIIGKRGIIPFIWANNVKPDAKTTEFTDMGWEVYPEGIYQIIKQFSKYPIKEIIITENGASFPDVIQENKINDEKRLKFYQDYLGYILKAKNEGVNIGGYFLWSLVDNFEWTFGYKPRFGIIYNDFSTQQRTVKATGYWFQDFLR